ncbi:MAG: hypothetical protein WDA22_17515 [Bacteroidota bacterium]
MISLLIVLSFLVPLSQQNSESGDEFPKEMTLNDSTNFMDISEFGIRVIYPKCVQPRKPRYHRDNRILSISIGSYVKGSFDNEINMRIEFATENSIKKRSDSYIEYIANGGMDDDSYPPQTEKEFLHRKKIIINGVVPDYFDEYHMVGNRRYGNHLWGGPNIGTSIDSYTYIDSLQIKITMNSLGDSISKKVNKIMVNDFGLEQGINRIDDVRHQLIKEILYQKYLQILYKIQFNKY